MSNTRHATIGVKIEQPEWVKAHYDEIRAGITDFEARRAAKIGHSKTLEEVSKKRADLKARDTRDWRRGIITSREDRFRTLSLETGWDARTEQMLKAPLQPWRDPYAMNLFGRIARGDDGAFTLDDFSTLDELRAVEEMQDRKLIVLGAKDEIHLLSQPAKTSREKYPGAVMPHPDLGGWVRVPDEVAKQGKQLRGIGDGIVLAAMSNIARRENLAPISDKKRASMLRPGGLAVTIHDLTTEANRIRSMRPDLDGYKFLHVETVRLIVKRLLGTGELTELEPPQRIYQNNEWHTTPRVYEARDLAEDQPITRHRLRPAA